MEIDQPIVPKWLVCGELPATYFKAVCHADILNYVHIKDISEIEDEE